MKSITFILVFVSVCISQDYFTQNLKPWERLGITSKEYSIAQQNGMPEDSIKFLTRQGIGIIEYYSHPWDSIGVSRERWFEYRHLGYADDMIISDLDTAGEKFKVDFSQDFNPQHKTALGLIPGYCQIKSGRNTLGRAQIIVGSVGIAGVISCAIFKPGAMPIPFLFCIVPVIPWSFATQ